MTKSYGKASSSGGKAQTAGKRPNYQLGVYDHRNGDRLTEGGVAWVGEDGIISLKLRPGVTLAYDPNLSIRLFPYDGRFEPPKPPAEEEEHVPLSPAPPQRESRPDGNDDGEGPF